MTETDQAAVLAEVEPCPFCGGKATVQRIRVDDYARDTLLKCTDCGASGPAYKHAYYNDAEATKLWNARALEQHRATRPPAGAELDAALRRVESALMHLGEEMVWMPPATVRACDLRTILTHFGPVKGGTVLPPQNESSGAVAEAVGKYPRNGTGGGGDMVLVPREPTADMMFVAGGVKLEALSYLKDANGHPQGSPSVNMDQAADIYRAMLAARPASPSPLPAEDADGLVAHWQRLRSIGGRPTSDYTATGDRLATAITTLQAEVAELKAAMADPYWMRRQVAEMDDDQ